MKLGPQTVSALVHAGLLAAVVFLVKVEAHLPTAITAFISGEQEDKPPPPPPPPTPAAPPKARGSRASGPPRAAAAAPPPTAPQAPTGSGSGAPPMDLGLLEADDGEGVPEGAVVVAAAAPVAEKVVAAKPPPPPAPVIKECTEDPSSPEPVTRADVDYPPGLAGMAGRVMAKALVSAEGIVTAVEIVGSLDPAIDQAVKESLLRWRFRPARRCHKDVAGAFTLALNFEHTE